MGPFAPKFTFTDEHKEKFAAELLRNPSQPFEAAVIVFGADNVSACAYTATEWPTDAKIIELQQRLLKDDKASGELVPTKNAALLRIWEWTEKKELDIETKLKAMKLIADMQGWIIKPEADDGATLHAMPPTISYVIGQDHDQPPAVANAG